MSIQENEQTTPSSPSLERGRDGSADTSSNRAPTPEGVGHPDISIPGSVKRQPRILVIGAGLAGMAAAVALESVSASVTLLEARKTLGGRAGSFEEPQTGEELDNCQHVLLGCCTNLVDFYRRIGVEHLIRWERAVNFVDARGRCHTLSGSAHLPAPLHLAASMARLCLLTWQERFSFAKAMIAMMETGREGRGRLADIPFGHWLDQHNQSPDLIRKLYDPILISAERRNPARQRRLGHPGFPGSDARAFRGLSAGPA